MYILPGKLGKCRKGQGVLWVASEDQDEKPNVVL